MSDTLPDVRFTADLIRSARKLSVVATDDDLWRVSASLGDHVWVSLAGDDLDRWECTCDEADCVHVVAVVLAERADRANRVIANLETTGNAPAPLAGKTAAQLLTVRPGHPPLPSWATELRAQQVAAVNKALAAFEEVDVVFLNGPPGAGKTLIANLIQRELGAEGLYVAPTKTLQDQVARDFSEARLLKGRANYETLSGMVDAWGQAQKTAVTSTVTCADCTSGGPDDACRWCEPTTECPYRIAKEQAARSRLPVLNTSYALTDWNKSRRPAFRGRELAVIDECDEMPDVVIGQVEVYMSRSRMRKLRLDPPAYRTKETTWGDWVTEQAIPRVKARLAELPPVTKAAPGEIRERRGLTELAEKLAVLAVELPQGRWVYDGYDRGDVIFRPIDSEPWGAKMLWSHAQRWLLMSGSIISVTQLARDLGLGGRYRLIDLPSTFDVARRPVYSVPVAEMTFKKKDTEWPKMIEGVRAVLRRHPGERVLVHTHSYALSQYLMKHVPQLQLGRKFFTYDEARDRDGALAAYKLHEGAVLFASSMSRGVDLPGDLCRVGVIAKVPWPNLGDKWVNARVRRTKDGQAWLAIQTVREVIQATARGMRSMEDQCTVYILDAQFQTNLYRKHKRLFPRWWRDAVVSMPARKLMKKPSEKSSRETSS